MSGWNAGKRTYQMAKDLHKQKGGLTVKYFADALQCGYRHQASPENYFVLRFYELDEKERETYLTSGRTKEADRKLNRFMTEKHNKILACKHLFYQYFAPFVQRSSLYMPETSWTEFLSFLEKQDSIILKPDRGLMGHGIVKIKVAEIEDKKELFETCQKEKLLIEEMICQHEALKQISSCVNSIRINMARDAKGEIRLIGGCLKCGADGADADNFHSGGIAYPLNLETGVVIGPGRNNKEIRDYEYHPGTEYYMPGFQVPYWDDVLDCAREAMKHMKEIGYIGWDIAVTPKGPELIEGNCHWPGGNIIQLDGLGKYPLIKECLEGVI